MKQPDGQPRSTNAEDYQDLPQAIGAMVKQLPDGHRIARHAHSRDQLLHSFSGAMRLRTEVQALIVPPDRAVFIPAGIAHAVEMHGAVEMRTLYLAREPETAASARLKVLSVSRLLRELIAALCEEPVDYEEGSRADAIAHLIAHEMRRATELPLSVPLPREPRLQGLCASLLAEPADARTLEAWSDTEGASARTLARLFERDLGMSFGEWRRRLRFHHAIEALSNGASIAQVSLACGYRSSSAFSAAFRKFTGVPPSGIAASEQRTLSE